MNQKLHITSLYKFYSLCLYLTAITFFFLLLASSSESYTQSISHVTQFQKGDAIVLITDLSGMGPSVTISFYDVSGREVSVVNKLLMPNGKLRIIIENHLKTSGCIVVESNNDLVLAEYCLLYKDGTCMIMPFQSVSEDKRCFINCFSPSFFQETFLVLSDPNGNGPMAQMEFYARTGELIKIIRKMLNPHGSLIIKVSDHIEKNIQGKVSIRSFGGGISVYGFQTYNKKKVFISPIYETSRELIITGLASEKESTNGVVITDISAKDNNVRISMIDINGNPLTIINKELPANSTISLNIEEFFGNMEVGYISIKGRHEIMADYWEQNQKTDVCFINSAIPRMDDAKFSENNLGISYFIYDNNIEYRLSFLNLNEKPIIADLESFNIDGKRIGGKRISLEFGKNISELANLFFGKNTLGTIIIRNADPNLIVNSRIQRTNNQTLLGKINAINR